MGNSLTCFGCKVRRGKASKWSQNPLSFIESSGQRLNTALRSLSSSSAAVKKEAIDDDLIRQQALAAVMLLRQHQQNSFVPRFDRSNSVQYPLLSSKKQNKLPRSSTSRPGSLSDLSQIQLNKNQVLIINDIYNEFR